MAPVPYGGQHQHQLGRRSVSHSHASSLKRTDNNSVSSTTSHSTHSLPNPQQAHALKLDEITRRIREQSDRFQRVLMPVAEQLKDFADSNPVLFTFLATFTLLSAFPTLVFFGFVSVLTFCIISTAVFLVCVSVAGVIFFGLAILLPILGATLALSGSLLVFLLGLFLSYRLLYHILDQTQDAATIDGILSGLRIWLDETQARVTFFTSTEPKGSVEDKPFLWEPGATPRGFAFRQSPGLPTPDHQEDSEKGSVKDKSKLSSNTEQNEDSDWVSDAEADVPAQFSPLQRSTMAAKGQADMASPQATPQVSSPLAPVLPSHAPSHAQSPSQPQPQSPPTTS